MILLIDDREDFRIPTAFVLEREGYAVRHTGSIEEALHMIHAEHPKLLIIDVMMPGLDGFGLAARLRKDKALDEVKIAFVTGNVCAREKAAAIGVNEVWEKPLMPEALVAEVMRLIGPPEAAP